MQPTCTIENYKIYFRVQKAHDALQKIYYDPVVEIIPTCFSARFMHMKLSHIPQLSIVSLARNTHIHVGLQLI